DALRAFPAALALLALHLDQEPVRIEGVQFAGLRLAKVRVPNVGGILQDVGDVLVGERTAVEGEPLRVQPDGNLPSGEPQPRVEVEDELDSPDEIGVVAGHQLDDFPSGLAGEADVLRSGGKAAVRCRVEQLPPGTVDGLPDPEQFSIRLVAGFAVTVGVAAGR